MARFGAANASTASGEEFWQKVAEVERMLREMKERSLRAQEELAQREHQEAQKCESTGLPGPAGSGLEPMQTLHIVVMFRVLLRTRHPQQFL